MQVFSNELHRWKEAIGAYQFYIEKLLTRKEDSVDSFMKDLINIFVLEECISTMLQIQKGDAQGATEGLIRMATACL